MHSLTTHLLSLSTTTPYQAAVNHEFLTSAGRNTLKQDRLSFWLAQDRVYAAHAYPKFIGSLIGSIPYNSSDGLESARELLNQRILKSLVVCLDNIVKEVTFFNTTASQWNLDLPTWQERKETRDYTAEMARIGSSGRIEDGLIFLWAMEKVYLDAWTYVTGLGSASGAVTAFSVNWSSPEFVRFVNELASLVDALEIAPGSDACNRAEKIWNRVVELEEMFWPREEEETLAASRK